MTQETQKNGGRFLDSTRLPTSALLTSPFNRGCEIHHNNKTKRRHKFRIVHDPLTTIDSECSRWSNTIKFVFGTKCSTTLAMPSVQDMLVNPRNSRLSISLAYGMASMSTPVHELSMGNVYIYTFNLPIHEQVISYPIGANEATS